MEYSSPIYIIDGARTPFLKVQQKPNPFSASDLAVEASKALLLRQPFAKEAIEEVIFGCVAPSFDEVNIGRIIALRLGLGNNIMGYTVQRNCASSLQAIDNAAQDIALGRHDLVLAGGTESMSHMPVFFSNEMVSWLTEFYTAKSFFQKLKSVGKFRPRFLKPIFGLMKGLTDPIVEMSMGQTAEKLAFLFDISREEMDAFALESQIRAKHALEKGYFEEIVPMVDKNGNWFDHDTGIRESSLEKLATLKPSFEKPFGLVTPGNSSQITDGAGVVLLASESFVKKYSLPVLGKILRITWSALSPSEMGLGPVHAISKLLTLENLKLSDIDYFEINEAFAAQVLACLKAMQSEEFAKTVLKKSEPLGKIDLKKLNVDGGAIALGHPVGASGARLVLHLLEVLKRHKARLGIASLCIGGGQGGAILLESAE